MIYMAIKGFLVSEGHCDYTVADVLQTDCHSTGSLTTNWAFSLRFTAYC